MSTCDVLDEYYPGFTKSSALFWCKFLLNLEEFVSVIMHQEYTISVASLVINTFHIIILTRTAMRKSSINLIMAAVAVFDIFTLFPTFERFISEFISLFRRCPKPPSYSEALMGIGFSEFKDFSQKCSTWLCFFIALIRTLVIRNPLNPKYEKLAHSKFSIHFIIGTVLFNMPFTVIGFLKYDIVEMGFWYECVRAINGRQYVMVISKFYRHNKLLIELLETLNALISKISPCLLFPIVTIFLIKEIRKADENRRKISSSSSAKTSDSRKTSRLVLYMTIMFFVSGFPYGLNTVVGFYYVHVPGIWQILQEIGFMLSLLLKLNTMSHFVVCLCMSHQYRQTAIGIIFCGHLALQDKKSSVVAVSQNQSRNVSAGVRTVA
ncbi:G-protein coupled receptors family 1 profile domain-containing protein [Caenorhabditis elegans]|uniref:G-protein coupled receptors family 1 profile domain-containing protein n=1 Tax=Caenorhabditis elegans TaxID=6239 RepID=P91159_CAEEL|nr:G-protein coupled receptors family 1 profile domain-containing protein [Caenorhabditis elegans]CCD67246.1 G-protein coupled receptors family 1 profile domain-containing protein [Caenorhabditis elegans]|eukprot:NP_503809.1 Serpentine Receptor, class W [Caenorhabditis elegans]